MAVYKHQGTITFFQNHRFLLRAAESSPRTAKVARAALLSAKRNLVRARSRLKQVRATLHPRDIKTFVAQKHPCLAGIIARENASYDPTLSYGGGHGNTSGPYGIPQANPGTKMSSAGADWATNPWTQLRWMIGYVQMYGGECAALDYRIRHGSY